MKSSQEERKDTCSTHAQRKREEKVELTGKIRTVEGGGGKREIRKPPFFGGKTANDAECCQKKVKSYNLP